MNKKKQCKFARSFLPDIDIQLKLNRIRILLCSGTVNEWKENNICEKWGIIRILLSVCVCLFYYHCISLLCDPLLFAGYKTLTYHYTNKKPTKILPTLELLYFICELLATVFFFDYVYSKPICTQRNNILKMYMLKSVVSFIRTVIYETK